MEGELIEFRLGLDAAGLARLRRRDFLTRARHGRAVAEQITSVWWDTPEAALAAAGVVVRLSVSGRTRLLTARAGGRAWNWPAAGDFPDPALLAGTGLAVFGQADVPGDLQPVSSAVFRRTLYRLDDTDLAFDIGEIAAGDAREPLCEARLRGAPGPVFALARAIAAAVPARPLSLTKAARGRRLAAGTAWAPVKSRPVALAREMTVGRAFQAVAGNCLEQLLANERSLLASRDPEAIHQMRVALRRLRSLFRVFRAAVAGPELDRLKGEVAWLLDHLGPARDARVFLGEMIAPVAAAHPEAVPLAAEWRVRCDAAEGAAIAAVAERRFALLAVDLAAWIACGDWRDAPRPVAGMAIRGFARGRLKRRYRKLLDAGGADLTELAPADLHRVRILGKQLRYAGEFFASLHPAKAAAPFLDTLETLQDALGGLNDIAVAEARLKAEAGEAERAWAAGLVAGWHAARRAALLEAAGLAWRACREAPRFWKT
jgi:inorganic triphosphatase YgiF